jgi:hypothetical protein
MAPHLRHRLDAVLAADAGDDDELLTTKQLAEWLQVSTAWCEIGRCKNYGPPFRRLARAVVRYRRGDVRRWLDERFHANTTEYVSDAKRQQRGEAA